MHLPYDPSVPLLGMYLMPRGNENTCFHEDSDKDSINSQEEKKLILFEPNRIITQEIDSQKL